MFPAGFLEEMRKDAQLLDVSELKRMNLNLIRSLLTVIKTEGEIRKSVPDNEEEVVSGGIRTKSS